MDMRTLAAEYLAACEFGKRLSADTVKAYRIDLRQYLSLIHIFHPFHTFREHPYKVQDDKAMDDLVGTIKEHGIMTPATVRPEKDGKGYEIIAGHRRHHGGTRAGLEEMPCIVREMTDPVSYTHLLRITWCPSCSISPAPRRV